MNVAGSVLLGAVLAGGRSRLSGSQPHRDFLAAGFCGGLTTFSTYAVEVVGLARDGHALVAAVYAIASVVTALAGFALGTALGRPARPLIAEGAS